MRRILLVVLPLILIGLVVYGMIELYNSSKPPTPTITVGGKNIPTAQGTYCWSGFLNSKCVDMISPPGIVTHNDLKAVVVSPEAKLNIDFNIKPTEDTLGANIWISDEETEVVNLKGNILTVPSKNGVYVYDVHARWEKGDSSSVFVIEVR